MRHLDSPEVNGTKDEWSSSFFDEDSGEHLSIDLSEEQVGWETDRSHLRKSDGDVELVKAKSLSSFTQKDVLPSLKLHSSKNQITPEPLHYGETKTFPSVASIFVIW